MIKKGLNIWVKVGKNSLKLRELMAEHLESMGIDGDDVRDDSDECAHITIDSEGVNSWHNFGNICSYKEISVAEFFNLTKKDLLEPKKKWCSIKLDGCDVYGYSHDKYVDLTQDQIERVLVILNEGES